MLVTNTVEWVCLIIEATMMGFYLIVNPYSHAPNIKIYHSSHLLGDEQVFKSIEFNHQETRSMMCYIISAAFFGICSTMCISALITVFVAFNYTMSLFQCFVLCFVPCWAMISLLLSMFITPKFLFYSRVDSVANRIMLAKMNVKCHVCNQDINAYTSISFYNGLWVHDWCN